MRPKHNQKQTRRNNCSWFYGICVKWVHKDGFDLLTHSALCNQEEANDADNVTNYKNPQTDFNCIRILFSASLQRLAGLKQNTQQTALIDREINKRTAVGCWWWSFHGQVLVVGRHLSSDASATVEWAWPLPTTSIQHLYNTNAIGIHKTCCGIRPANILLWL